MILKLIKNNTVMLKKTLLTTVLTAMIGFLAAQSLQFEWEGTVYQDGQTIISPFNEDFYEYVQELKIRNLTGNDMGVVVEREILQNAEGTMIYFCWGVCLSPDVSVSDPVNVPAQTLSDEEFGAHVMFTEGETGVVKVKYYAYDRSDPDNRISITILAGATAGVAEHTINVGQAYPNPATSEVHFDLQSNDDVNVVVYNLLGQEVKSQFVSAHQSRVNIAVNDLQAGIYFCRFSINGAVVKTEKFIVKH